MEKNFKCFQLKYMKLKTKKKQEFYSLFVNFNIYEYKKKYFVP